MGGIAVHIGVPVALLAGAGEGIGLKNGKGIGGRLWRCGSQDRGSQTPERCPAIWQIYAVEH